MEFADVFAVDSSELGSTDLVTHSINTGESLPVMLVEKKGGSRRLPPAKLGHEDGRLSAT